MALWISRMSALVWSTANPVDIAESYKSRTRSSRFCMDLCMDPISPAVRPAAGGDSLSMGASVQKEVQDQQQQHAACYGGQRAPDAHRKTSQSRNPTIALSTWPVTTRARTTRTRDGLGRSSSSTAWSSEAWAVTMSSMGAWEPVPGSPSSRSATMPDSPRPRCPRDVPAGQAYGLP